MSRPKDVDQAHAALLKDDSPVFPSGSSAEAVQLPGSKDDCAICRACCVLPVLSCCRGSTVVQRSTTARAVRTTTTSAVTHEVRQIVWSQQGSAQFLICSATVFADETA